MNDWSPINSVHNQFVEINAIRTDKLTIQLQNRAGAHTEAISIISCFLCHRFFTFTLLVRNSADIG
jgi:hypothetical protein